MSALARPRLAIVIHRYLPDAGGGAEEHCRRLAHSLRDHVSVDVITTCAADHHTWANELPEGVEDHGDGLRTLRFRTKRRKGRLESAILGRLLPRLPHPVALEDRWLRALGPDSPALLEFIGANAAIYGAVIFYTYLYGTTVHGVGRAGPRTLLIPTAHNEPALRLARQKNAIRSAAALAFLTPEEEALVDERCETQRTPRLLLGAELSPESFLSGDAARFRERHGLAAPFLLYVGRVERSKGLGELFSLYETHRDRLPLLVLAGKPGPLRVPRGVRSLGFLTEGEKRDALAAATALVQPSARESLSLVLLEAWAQRRPVIVNGRCAPMRGQCERSGGGIAYANDAEFVAAVDTVRDPGPGRNLGERGCAFTKESYSPGTMAVRLMPFLKQLGWIAERPVLSTSLQK